MKKKLHIWIMAIILLMPCCQIKDFYEALEVNIPICETVYTGKYSEIIKYIPLTYITEYNKEYFDPAIRFSDVKQVMDFLEINPDIRNELNFKTIFLSN